LSDEDSEDAKKDRIRTLRMLLRCWVQAANKSRSKDHFKKAEAVGKDVQEKLEAADLKNTGDFCEVLKDVATNYSNFGKAPQAMEAWRGAYALEKQLGIRDAAHVASCRGLADVHIAQKEYPNALHFLNEAVTILEVESPKSEDFAVTLMRQATCQFRCGEQSQAIASFERGLELYRQAGGNQFSSAFGSYLWSFQGMLMENKLFARSIQVGEEALKVLERCGMAKDNFYADVTNRLNFCKNKLDPSHPLSVPVKKEEKVRVLVPAGNISCSCCGVTPKVEKADEPMRETGQVSFKKCSRCKAVHYCSIGCQKADWKKGHSKVCVAKK
jgi:tetratricopeptide (TPR) repeat protein